MQLEPFENDGYAVWLSEDEQDQLLEQVKEKPKRQLAFRALLHGLRTDELRWVRISKLRELETEQEAYKLTVSEGKTGYREVPVSRKMVEQMRLVKNVTSTRKDRPLITTGNRGIRRWMERARDELAEETGESNWQYVSPHDLRRTWATHTYYSLDAANAREIVMRWGGWSSADTFRSNYLGRETDEMAAEMMDAAGLR